jgi:hypothetical protein
MTIPRSSAMFIAVDIRCGRAFRNALVRYRRGSAWAAAYLPSCARLSSGNRREPRPASTAFSPFTPHLAAVDDSAVELKRN